MNRPQLATCFACHGQVSNQARQCPHCGQPFAAPKKGLSNGALAGIGVAAFAGFVVLAAAILGSSKAPPTKPLPPEPPSASVVAEMDRSETSLILRKLYPRWCRVQAADQKWGDIYDSTHSFPAAIASLEALQYVEAVELIPAAEVPASAACATIIRDEFTGWLAKSQDVSAEQWKCLTKDRKSIEAKLAANTFSHATTCQALLPVFANGAIACIKKLFTCDRGPCEIYQVASKLGVACVP